MKIVTWNINGIRSVKNKGFFEFIKKEDPDILCIQESKAHPEQLDKALLDPLQSQNFWSPASRKGYSGVATFVKSSENLKVLEAKKGIGIRKFDHEGRFMITKHKDFTLYNVYFPNGSASEERHLFKQEFLKKFSHFLKKQISRGEKMIIVGDYNIAHKEHDVFDPVRLSKISGFLPEERKWLDSFLNLNFIDAFRHFYPDSKNCYSWWSYRENARTKNKGWRIDYICITKELISRVKSVKMLDQQWGSDHCPVMMEMD